MPNPPDSKKIPPVAEQYKKLATDLRFGIEALTRVETAAHRDKNQRS